MQISVCQITDKPEPVSKLEAGCRVYQAVCWNKTETCNGAWEFRVFWGFQQVSDNDTVVVLFFEIWRSAEDVFKHLAQLKISGSEFDSAWKKSRSKSRKNKMKAQTIQDLLGDFVKHLDNLTEKAARSSQPDEVGLDTWRMFLPDLD